MRTTLATEEIRFGDNDTLPALVSNLVDAELLIILTDQQGLFTAAPSINSDATLISEISINDTRLDSMEGDSRSVLGGAACPPKCAPARAGHPFRRSRGRRRPPQQRHYLDHRRQRTRHLFFTRHRTSGGKKTLAGRKTTV